jgi:hypothetical protein
MTTITKRKGTIDMTATPQERRSSDADITEIKNIVLRLEQTFLIHSTEHQEWNKKLCEHESALFGNRDGSNGDRIGLIQKTNTMWKTRSGIGEVFWKILGGVGMAAALLIAGLK